MRMAFLAASPMSMTRPICAYTFRSKWRTNMPIIVPRMTVGVASSTAKGSPQLSYCAASSRNTNSTAMPKMTGAWPSDFFSWSVRPDHS